MLLLTAHLRTLEDLGNIPEPKQTCLSSGNGLTQIIFRPTKENVVEQLKRLKTDKSPGIDELHPKFLHEVRGEIGEVLAQIFNKSMQTGHGRCTTGMERCPHSAIV